MWGLCRSKISGAIRSVAVLSSRNGSCCGVSTSASGKMWTGRASISSLRLVKSDGSNTNNINNHNHNNNHNHYSSLVGNGNLDYLFAFQRRAYATNLADRLKKMSGGDKEKLAKKMVELQDFKDQPVTVVDENGKRVGVYKGADEVKKVSHEMGRLVIRISENKDEFIGKLMDQQAAEEFAYAETFRVPEKYKVKLQKPPKEKTFGFSPTTSEEDLKTKLNKAYDRIAKGDYVVFVQTKKKGLRAPPLDYSKSEFVRTEMLKVANVNERKCHRDSQNIKLFFTPLARVKK
eukprot:Nk52_evm1s490 gene=Nk52_evmTU1s490